MNWKSIRVLEDVHYKVRLQAVKEDVGINELINLMVNDRIENNKGIEIKKEVE